MLLFCAPARRRQAQEQRVCMSSSAVWVASVRSGKLSNLLWKCSSWYHLDLLEKLNDRHWLSEAQMPMAVASCCAAELIVLAADAPGQSSVIVNVLQQELLSNIAPG